METEAGGRDCSFFDLKKGKHGQVELCDESVCVIQFLLLHLDSDKVIQLCNLDGQ